LAAKVSSGDVKITAVAIWCGQDVVPRRAPKCIGVKSAGPARKRVNGNVVS